MVHLCCRMCQNFLPFLRLNNTPLYVYNILLIHLSVDGLLDCTRLLYIMLLCTNIFLISCFHLKKKNTYPEVEL